MVRGKLHNLDSVNMWLNRADGESVTVPGVTILRNASEVRQAKARMMSVSAQSVMSIDLTFGHCDRRRLTRSSTFCSPIMSMLRRSTRARCLESHLCTAPITS